jgi:hypothetical protein
MTNNGAKKTKKQYILHNDGGFESFGDWLDNIPGNWDEQIKMRDLTYLLKLRKL